MGFLDKAKSKLQEVTKNLGEETIRVIDFGDKDKAEENDHEQNKSQVQEKEVKTRKHNVFDVDVEDDEDYFNSRAEEPLNSDSSDVPSIKDNVAQDVLELLGIPSTFEIEEDVFLPEDLMDIRFNMQKPMGYDMGEVQNFVSRVKVSVARFVELLELRNKHVMELATTVDKLQIDVNNIKFQAELANGINIIPTSDSEELESEISRLSSIVKRYEEEARLASNHLSPQDESRMNELQDSISILQNENEQLQEKVTNLVNENAVLIEKLDEFDELDINQNIDYSNLNNHDDSDALMGVSDTLPEIEDEPLMSLGDDSGLPNIDFRDYEGNDDYVDPKAPTAPAMGDTGASWGSNVNNSGSDNDFSIENPMFNDEDDDSLPLPMDSSIISYADDDLPVPDLNEFRDSRTHEVDDSPISFDFKEEDLESPIEYHTNKYEIDDDPLGLYGDDAFSPISDNDSENDNNFLNNYKDWKQQ